MRWSDEDIFAVEEAISAGVIHAPKNEIIEPTEWESYETFTPMVFPAVLVNWSSTRLGDIEVKLHVPYKWSANIADIATAMRKRLIVHISEFDMD